MNTETYLAPKQYCNKCLYKKEVDLYQSTPGKKPYIVDIHCDVIKRRCFDYEFNHKGIEFGTMNIKEVRIVIDAINEKAKETISELVEKEFPYKYTSVPKSLPLKLKFIPNSNELTFENEEMHNFFETLMKGCFLNRDFDCQFYRSIDK